MKKGLSFFLLVSLLAFGCKKSDSTTNPIPEPTGRQRDIPWPSLANSPWPMNHGNPQSTGRSKLPGPTIGQLLWDKGPAYGSFSAVAVTSDSLLVTGFYMTAIDLNDSVRWTALPSVLSDKMTSTPIATASGLLLCASQKGMVYAVHPDGTIAWTLNLGEPVYQQGTNLGLDGTFFCISAQKTLFAVSQAGQVNWRLTDAQFSGDERSVLTLSPDGKTLYVPGSGVTLNAIDVATHSVRWRFGTSPVLDLAPIVDSDGNIYVLGSDSAAAPNPSLISLGSDGSVRWVYPHGNHFSQIMAGDPTIDLNGNIYFAFDTLYSVGPNGVLRWKKDLSVFGTNPAGDVPLVCDESGRIYLVVGTGGFTVQTIAAFDEGGQVLWSLSFDTSGWSVDSSPAILWGGRLALEGLKNPKLWLFN